MTYGKYPRELLGSKTNIGKTEKKDNMNQQEQ